MPSKFGREFSVPKEFPSVLKAFTREVLRAQPENIYEFGSQYFTELLAQAEAARAAQDSGPRRLTPEELRSLLSDMFIQADVDGSNTLDRNEFKTVLNMAELGLSEREVRLLHAEADLDASGHIDYNEFIPLAVDLVQSMYAKMDAEAAQEAEEEAAREDAKAYLVHGMTKEQVESVMMDIFQKSDADASGQLSLSEFQKCCKDADIGLTRKEINVLMHQCDVDGDGQISYEEFVPLCFEMLTEILKDQLLSDKRQPTELEEYLNSVFKEADSMGDGVLDGNMLKQVLLEADLGMSRLQIHSVIAVADFDDESMVAYKKFTPKAAEIIYRMLDPDAQIERYQAIEGMMENEEFALVHGQTEDDLIQILNSEFASYDPDGSGVLRKADVQQVLQGSSLSLSWNEVNTLISAVDVDGEGNIRYGDLAMYAFPILQYVAQNDVVY